MISTHKDLYLKGLFFKVFMYSTTTSNLPSGLSTLSESIAQLLVAWLSKGPVVLHLNNQSEGLQLPALLLASDSCSVKIGSDIQKDIQMNDYGIGMTLTVCQQSFPCFVPYHAIYGVMDSNKQSRLWVTQAPPSCRPRLEEILAMGATAENALRVFMGLERV